jgi:hypothetical protein
VTGALAGLGLGVAVLAVGLPAAERSRDVPPPGSVAGAVRETLPTERTDVVPPVVRTINAANAAQPGGPN